MKGLYISPDVRDFSGINKKVHEQVSSFINNGVEMELFMETNSIPKRIVNMIPIFSRQYFNRFMNLPSDFVYIRIPKVIDLDFILRFRKLKKDRIVILEIPTYPFFSERKGVRALPFTIKTLIWSRFLNSSVDRIVTYSKDEEIFGVKTFQLSNGVNVSQIEEKKTTFSSGEITLVGVASLSYWHGYDRLIVSMGEYKKKNGNVPAKFLIVGPANDELLNDYYSLIKKYNLAEEVQILGSMVGKELDNIFQKADLAVDALGRHRSGVYYNSSLKGKEYLARGVPIISGVETELDSFPDFKYYYRVTANEELINFEDVIDFYQRCIVSSGKKSNTIINEIREFAFNHVDMDITMEPLVRYLRENKR